MTLARRSGWFRVPTLVDCFEVFRVTTESQAARSDQVGALVRGAKCGIGSAAFASRRPHHPATTANLGVDEMAYSSP
jgi:hypothetical protein